MSVARCLASSGRVLLLAGAMMISACALMAGPPRVRQGQLYAPGQPAYDAYFRDVHAVRSPAWAEERLVARRPLAQALAISPDAPDATLAQLTHDRMTEVAKVAGPLTLEIVGVEARAVAAAPKNLPAAARPLFEAVEATARGELDRGRRMRTASMQLEKLLRSGRELRPRVATDFAGAGKAEEVRRELDASFEVVAPLVTQSHALAQGADDFVLDLKRAVAAPRGTSTSSAKGVANAAGTSNPAPDGRPVPAGKSPHVAKPLPADKPVPAEKAVPVAPPREVFNP